MLDFRSKGVEIPSMGAFIAGTGQAGSADVFAAFIVERFTDIDDLHARGAAVFAAAVHELVDDFSRFGTPRFNCIVAGWSRSMSRVRIANFLLVHGERRIEFHGDDAWSMSPAWGGPSQDSVVGRIFREGPESFNPIRDGIPVMQMQRHFRSEPSELIPSAHLVGGYVTLTIVDKAGVSTEIIHTWPEDMVGQKIEPTEALDVIVPLFAGSRAERRRQEKLQRSAVA